MLKVDRVSKTFVAADRVTHALENICLNVKKGEFLSLVGPSGCGKSTLLNVVAGLEKATVGKVFCEGQEVTGPGPDRVVMFQEAALFPWLTVISNVEYGMKVAGVSKVERRKRAMDYLKMVNLADFSSSFPHELSGGMRQRVALARALAIDTDILLMDEPFASLDAETRKMLHNELQQIWVNTAKTIIFVTHNVEEAVYLADRIIVMSSNPGRVKVEFNVNLERPRKMESVEVNFFIKRIVQELKEEVGFRPGLDLSTEWALPGNAFVPQTGSHTRAVNIEL